MAITSTPESLTPDTRTNRRRLRVVTAAVSTLLVVLTSLFAGAGAAQARPSDNQGGMTTKDGCSLYAYPVFTRGGGWNTQVVTQTAVRCTSKKTVTVTQWLKKDIARGNDEYLVGRSWNVTIAANRWVSSRPPPTAGSPPA